jgi:hypothetical protein
MHRHQCLQGERQTRCSCKNSKISSYYSRQGLRGGNLCGACTVLAAVAMLVAAVGSMSSHAWHTSSCKAQGHLQVTLAVSSWLMLTHITAGRSCSAPAAAVAAAVCKRTCAAGFCDAECRCHCYCCVCCVASCLQDAQACLGCQGLRAGHHALGGVDRGAPAAYNISADVEACSPTYVEACMLCSMRLSPSCRFGKQNLR